MRCTWCNEPQPQEALKPAGSVTGGGIHGYGYQRCRDGAACAERSGELLWATSVSEARLNGGSLTGRYGCLDPLCSHPREQVFNGGGAG